MAHQSQIIFCTVVKALFPSYFRNKKVLDIGSLDVNGNNRYLFYRCSYTGLDLSKGPNVDIVCAGWNWWAPDGYYDFIISTECGEHDCMWDHTIKNAIRMLKPGGMFLYTCATTGRPEHGTKRTDVFSSPFTTDYYRNLTEQDIRSIDSFNGIWSYSRVSVDEQSHDLRFVGIKRRGKVKFTPNLFVLITTYIRSFVDRRIRDFRNLFANCF